MVCCVIDVWDCKVVRDRSAGVTRSEWKWRESSRAHPKAQVQTSNVQSSDMKRPTPAPHGSPGHTRTRTSLPHSICYQIFGASLISQQSRAMTCVHPIMLNLSFCVQLECESKFARDLLISMRMSIAKLPATRRLQMYTIKSRPLYVNPNWIEPNVIYWFLSFQILQNYTSRPIADWGWMKDTNPVVESFPLMSRSIGNLVDQRRLDPDGSTRRLGTLKILAS